jgi:hypothetical protein
MSVCGLVAVAEVLVLVRLPRLHDLAAVAVLVVDIANL